MILHEKEKTIGMIVSKMNINYGSRLSKMQDNLIHFSTRNQQDIDRLTT